MDSHNRWVEAHDVHRQTYLMSYHTPPFHLTELSIHSDEVVPHCGAPTPHSQLYSRSYKDLLT